MKKKLVLPKFKNEDEERKFWYNIDLSEYYEHDFDDITKNLSSTIEPVLMILMGIMVGFVAISVITPIYEITNSLKR